MTPHQSGAIGLFIFSFASFLSSATCVQLVSSMSQSTLPIRTSREPQSRASPYPPHRVCHDPALPLGSSIYGQNNFDTLFDGIPGSPNASYSSIGSNNSRSSSVLHTTRDESLSQPNFTQTGNSHYSGAPSENHPSQSAYLITKLTSRIKLDNEHRRFAQDFNLVRYHF